MEIFRERCGMTISQLNRLSGVSRTTIYAYEKGSPIKRETEIELLESLKRSKMATNIRDEIDAALLKLGVSLQAPSEISHIIDELNTIKNMLMQFSSPEGDFDPDFSTLSSKEIEELEFAVSLIHSEMGVLKSAHRPTSVE